MMRPPDQNRVLLFGGTFDPIHNGHIAVCRAAADILAAGRVILIPSAQPPHKRHAAISPAGHRLAMTQLAAAFDERCEVSDDEIKRAGLSYTLLTVRHFRKQFGPDAELCWLIGADMLADLPNWHRVGELLDECRIVTAGRPGQDLDNWRPAAEVISPRQAAQLRRDILDTPLVDVSATEIRRRAAAGLPIDGMVPEAVADYIHRHGLYRAAGSTGDK